MDTTLLPPENCVSAVNIPRVPSPDKKGILKIEPEPMTIFVFLRKWVMVPVGFVGMIVSSMVFFMANIQGTIEAVYRANPVRSDTIYRDCVSSVGVDNGLFLREFVFEEPGPIEMRMIIVRHGQGAEERIEIKHKNGCGKK